MPRSAVIEITDRRNQKWPPSLMHGDILALEEERPASNVSKRKQQRLGISPSLYLSPMSGEPSRFNARAMARWLANRGRPPAKRQSPGPRPTLAELQRSHCWTWVFW